MTFRAEARNLANASPGLRVPTVFDRNNPVVRFSGLNETDAGAEYMAVGS